MADKRDYYEVLGVDKGADADTIKKAFRQKAKQYHPDLHPGDASAEANFKEVNEAYEVLSDDQKRAAYDQFGHDGPQGFGGGGSYTGGAGGFGGFGDVGDIFDAFFGGMGGASGRQRNGPTQGADLRYELSISFEEAAFGCTKVIDVTRQENCDSCGGSGARKGTSPRTCPICKGTGQVQVAQSTAFGRFVNLRTCDNCRGTGKLIDDPCPDCRGTGHVRKARKIQIKVPRGIDNAQAIPLRGQGEPGQRGGPNGDLLVFIRVKPHKLFTRDGYDIRCEIPISFGQATLGADLEVPTLDGKTSFHIPEGTQTGTTFRLRDRGIYQLNNGNRRGDQYIKVNIEVPKRLTDEQKEILRRFDATLTDTQDQRKGFWERLKDTLNG